MSKKSFTDDAVDFIEESCLQVFESLEDFVTYAMEQTNFSDAVNALQDLNRKLDGRTIYLAQDDFFFFGDLERIYVGDEVEDFFNENGFFDESDPYREIYNH